MTPEISFVVIFVVVVVAVFAFGAAVITPGSVLGARLRALGGQQAQRIENKPAIRERVEQALDPLSKAIPLSPSDVSRTRRWLMQAGYRDAMDVNYYFGARILMATIGFVSVAVLTAFKNPPLLIGVTGLGFILPRFILKRMIRDRQARIRLGLPDALDLTVICVEAGLALDQALMRVGQDLHHAHPDLSEEFHLVNLEMRAGKPRAEALRNLVERTGVDDLRALVGTLIQADRFGTSIAQALRLHSDSLRTERIQRIQRAEEQAAKTTIKMVPPLVIWLKKIGLSFWESLRRMIRGDFLRPCASLLRGRTVEMAPFQKVPRIFAITMLVLFLVVLAIVRRHP
jgi:tight adherence protein C